MKVLHVFYDLVVCPLTFDIMFTAAAATAAVRRNGFDGFVLHVVMPPLVDGKYVWRDVSAKDKDLTNDEKIRRVHEILAPFGNVCRYCAGANVVWNRGTMNKLLLDAGDAVFPAGYNPTMVRGVYTADQLYSHYTTRTEDLCKTISTRFTKNSSKQGLVITYDQRSLSHHSEKNTDTSLMTGVLKLLECELKSTNVNVSSLPLHYRVHQLCNSDLHIAMSGGPNLLPWFMENTKSLVWVDKNPDPGLSSEQRLRLLGLGDSFGQWPQAEPCRRFVWYDTKPSAEQMFEEIKECLQSSQFKS